MYFKIRDGKSKNCTFDIMNENNEPKMKKILGLRIKMLKIIIYLKFIF